MRHILGLLTILICFPISARANNWPGWRGPGGQGHCAEKNLPLKWDRATNVRWKIALPDTGNSTPIVWGNRIFLTQATEKGTRRALWCLARNDGKLVWKKEIVFKDKEPTHDTNPYCSASPVTDGKRVYVSHGSAGLFCYDFSGKQLWHKDLGKLHHIWGNASSPILYKNLVIIWCGPGKRQFLLALDKKRGDRVWEHQEPGGHLGDDRRFWIGSWSTPIIVKVKDHDELLLGVPRKFKCFDPEKGKELWSCDGLSNLVYTSPLHADGVAVAMSGYHGPALAVRLGGKGDVTKTHRLWHHTQSNPQRIGSGVIVDKKLYLLNENGIMQCLDPTTGKDIGDKKRLPGLNWGSLVAADGKLFVTNMDGTTYVLAAKPKLELLATNRLGEMTRASIAVSNGELFIRTYKHLWCIRKKK